jgi:hypothetical protein
VVVRAVFGALFSDTRWTSNHSGASQELSRGLTLVLPGCRLIDSASRTHAATVIGFDGFTGSILCVVPEHLLAFAATMDVKKKHEIEAALATEAQAISAGHLKEENPLDLSDDFRAFCEACRRGDLKVCQEKISEGVNINARDKFDYTPLILVRPSALHPE